MLQNRFLLLHDHFFPLQNDFLPLQNEFFLLQNDFPPLHNKFFLPQNLFPLQTNHFNALQPIIVTIIHCQEMLLFVDKQGINNYT